MGEPDSARGETRTVTSVETTFDIIEMLLELGGATMTELTQELDYSKSTVHSHLRTLEKRNYVIREAFEYRPSMKFFDIGQRVTNEHIEIYRVGRKEVEKLAQETGEDGWILYEEWGQGIYVFRQRGQKSVDDFPIGRQAGLHCTAAGKAVMAHLPDDRVEAIIEQYGLPAVTEQTITSRSKLQDELEAIRDSGVAFSTEEAIPGIKAVATPVLAPDDTVLGAISISGPSSRLRGEFFEEELPNRLRESSNLIEIEVMKETHEYQY